jgi:electron transfer flavoprotein alpha subunit
MILVIAEQRGGQLHRASWESIAAAQRIAGGEPVTVLLPGHDLARVGAELATAALERVVLLEHEGLAAYTADGYLQALSPWIQAHGPRLVILPHTYQARDFAPALAARLERALVTDVTGFRERDGQLACTRPMFQGKLAADVVPQGESPYFVSVQIGAFRADAVVRGEAAARVDSEAAAVDPSAIRQQPEALFQEARQAVDLSQAERIVAIGRGIKGQEHMPVAQALADALGAELAASRPICDSGWLPMERQVGSSGQTVAPKLYVAVGISGAIQHVVGMKGARTIVAVNKDAEAPIFEVADYGIVGDLFEIVPAITQELKK